MLNLKKLEELLILKQLKVTPTRLKLLNIIFEYKNAIPYSEIQKELKEFDRVTLYRSLKSLIEHGIIHIALSRGEENYYALCQNSCSIQKHEHRHIHFKCISCYSVSCIQTDTPLMITIPNYDILQLEIEASGICNNCK